MLTVAWILFGPSGGQRDALRDPARVAQSRERDQRRGGELIDLRAVEPVDVHPVRRGGQAGDLERPRRLIGRVDVHRLEVARGQLGQEREPRDGHVRLAGQSHRGLELAGHRVLGYREGAPVGPHQDQDDHDQRDPRPSPAPPPADRDSRPLTGSVGSLCLPGRRVLRRLRLPGGRRVLRRLRLPGGRRRALRSLCLPGGRRRVLRAADSAAPAAAKRASAVPGVPAAAATGDLGGWVLHSWRAR